MCLDKCGSKSPTTCGAKGSPLVTRREANRNVHLMLGELGEIIDDDITFVDVVVNERNAFCRPSPRKAETRARLRRAALNLNSVSKTRVRGYERVDLNANPPVAYTRTRHRSPTSAPGLGNSSKHKCSGLIKLFSRFLCHVPVQQLSKTVG